MLWLLSVPATRVPAVPARPSRAMKPTFLILAALVLASCSTASLREHRIAKNPAYFQSLPAEEQTLVRAGKLRVGMLPESVVMAIGRPNRILHGQGEGGRNVSVWVYQGQEPVYVGHGYDYPVVGRCGRVYWPYSAPSYVYLPYVRAKVQFTNNRVTAWESAGR